MQVVVATHGHCFDGLASAVVFTKLFRAVVSDKATFTYRACGYGEGQQSGTENVLVGDENVILDYKFSANEKLTWYFDHHRTAFEKPGDKAFFDERVPTGHFFYDPACTSCTKLVNAVSLERFGVPMTGLEELVRWADIIDSAAFGTPEQALDRTNPVMRLAAVIERHGDDHLLSRLVPLLLERSVEEVAASADINKRYSKISEQHERFVRRVREKAERRGRVVYVDLTEEPLETIGKFVTYALYPDAVYSVLVGCMKNAAKISVGYNPWCGQASDVDISAICARYGGGGHPFVGAIQFKAGELARAREVATAIALELDR
jgi:hypothetical protein